MNEQPENQRIGDRVTVAVVPRQRWSLVVFIDNDALPAEGWIEHLVECADDTGAAVVGPLIMHGPNEKYGQIRQPA